MVLVLGPMLMGVSPVLGGGLEVDPVPMEMGVSMEVLGPPVTGVCPGVELEHLSSNL